ncbi:MAG: hypothetical protein WD080_03855 [Egibacteraceae bacterium]
MGPTETCEVCGTEVAPHEAVRAELALSDASICPTPMSFHPACYERATEVWEQPGEALCDVDPEFPETAHWLARSRRDS